MAHNCMFGPNTVTWKVNREGVLIVGGGRALLLQVGHPLVAAGVVEHSDYDVDPWSRLYRTLDTVLKISFAKPEISEEAAARLRNVHARVKGVAPDGTPYDANQPDLLVWVWATLFETSLLIYQRYVGLLTGGEIERLYREQAPFLLACGVPEGSWPEDYPAFVRYFEKMIETEIRPTDGSQWIAEAVMRPPLPLLLRPLAAPVNLVTIGTLPPTLRERYGFDWGPGRERMLRASAATIRRMMPLIPAALRQLPANYAVSHDFTPPRLLRPRGVARA